MGDMLQESPAEGGLNPASIDQLKSTLKSSKLLTPDSDEYTARSKRWADSSSKPAGAILLAASNHDISTTLRLAQSHGIDFAVCGGGHSTSGASSSSGGIVIDLSPMRGVEVDPESKAVTAQGGCLWVDVDEALGAHGLATVGGTINHTGIGGLTLGGGYGWLSGQHGLTIDNLLSVDMVGADGRLVKCSPTENEHLFWAVRGAGQSFGVATSFTFRAFDQSSDIFAGSLVFTPDKIPAVVNFANGCPEAGKGQAACILVFAVAPPPISQPTMIASIFFNGPEDKAKSFFQPLLDLDPVVNDTKMMPYSALNGMLNPVVPHGGRKSTKGACFQLPMQAAFATSLFEQFSAFVKGNPDASRSLIIMEFFYPDKICKTSNRAMAFANRDFYQNIMAQPVWSEEGNDERCRQWARDMTLLFKREFETTGFSGKEGKVMGGIGTYGNYDGDGIREPGERGQTIFGDNLERLMELKRIWDPNNAFSKSHLLGPQSDAWHGGSVAMEVKA
ncbi:MAG: hypothetical protein Q9174_004210 [Haloplaca sp. 1 TL-2023]